VRNAVKDGKRIMADDGRYRWKKSAFRERLSTIFDDRFFDTGTPL
jgi:hypothetical protein